MNYFDGKKCLDEILNAVTPEDEKLFFLNIEYLKNYDGVVIGQVHNDGFGNILMFFLLRTLVALMTYTHGTALKKQRRNWKDKKIHHQNAFH